MLLFIRKNIKKGVKVSYNKDSEILGLTLDKTFFGFDEPLFIWFTYASPLNSPYTISRNIDVLDKLETLFFSLRIFFSNKNRLLVWESVHPQPVTARNEQTYIQ